MWELLDLFDQLDQNNNGVIDFTEFTRVFKGKGVEETQRYFDRFSEGNDSVRIFFCKLTGSWH
jgi:Ca2+-binding EF-hand superfamily protein